MEGIVVHYNKTFDEFSTHMERGVSPGAYMGSLTLQAVETGDAYWIANSPREMKEKLGLGVLMTIAMVVMQILELICLVIVTGFVMAGEGFAALAHGKTAEYHQKTKLVAGTLLFFIKSMFSDSVAHIRKLVESSNDEEDGGELRRTIDVDNPGIGEEEDTSRSPAVEDTESDEASVEQERLAEADRAKKAAAEQVVGEEVDRMQAWVRKQCQSSANPAAEAKAEEEARAATAKAAADAVIVARFQKNVDMCGMKDVCVGVISWVTTLRESVRVHGAPRDCGAVKDAQYGLKNARLYFEATPGPSVYDIIRSNGGGKVTEVQLDDLLSDPVDINSL